MTERSDGQTDPAEDFGPVEGYLATASSGRHSRAVRDAMVEAVLGRFDGVDVANPLESSRTAFGRLTGVSPEALAVGSQTSVTSSAVVANLPRIAPGREVLCIDGDFGSVVFPFSVSVFSPDLRVRHVPCEALADEIGPDTGLIAFSLVQSADGALVDAEAVRQAAAEVGAWTYVDTTQAVGWLPVGPGESFDPGQFDVTVCATYKWLCTPRGVTMTSFSTRALEEMQPVHTSWFSGRNLDRSGYGPTVDLADGARRFDVSPPWPQYVGQRVSLDYFTPERIPAIRDHDLGLAARFCQALDLPEPSTPIVSVPDPDEAICRAAAQANLAVSPRNGLARFSFHVYNTDRDVDRAVAAVRSSS